MDLPLITPTWTLLDHRHIHIEVSSKCTLKCPRCPRTELKPEALNREISLAEFQRAFTQDLLKEIEEITFCGDIGDPIYAKDFLRIIEYIKASRFSTRLTIVTNGSYREPSWWTDLGSLLHNNDTVTFSLDGWDQESNQKYRVNSDWDSIVRGIQALRANSSCIMNWSAIYFSFNQREMEYMESLARDLGFNTFTKVCSTKFDGQYSTDGADSLKPFDQFVSSGVYNLTQSVLNLSGYQPINRIIPNIRHPWARCMRGEKEMFINVDGLVYPCPWFNSGYIINDFVEKYRDQICIKTRTLKEIIQDPLWQELYTRFEIAPLEICNLKCKNAR